LRIGYDDGRFSMACHRFVLAAELFIWTRVMLMWQWWQWRTTSTLFVPFLAIKVLVRVVVIVVVVFGSLLSTILVSNRALKVIFFFKDFFLVRSYFIFGIRLGIGFNTSI
jgi:hypothetical protein